ncbi:MAG: YihA family ribosome biogenesis GTP-binding protein [Firmicutes bacterium]|nr:YihA family ribosome biogenesis GTP-binding protein [Bacillota bacterium]
MKIVSAEFVISAASPSQFPEEGFPELALVGRSNVGKSSLINRLVGRRSLAKTSSTPGKTRLLNFYRINNAWHWVDLPGYGYAQVSKSMRRDWQGLIEKYLRNRPQLRGVIQLVDIRHPPTENDRQMFEWLTHWGFPVVVVATKADKIARGRWPQHLKTVREGLNLSPSFPLVLFSSEKGIGVEELGKLIEELLTSK